MSAWGPGTVVIIDKAGRILVDIQNEPDLADVCYRMVMKRLRRCACGRAFICIVPAPRKRCRECAAKAKREATNARSRRHYQRKKQAAAGG